MHICDSCGDRLPKKCGVLYEDGEFKCNLCVAAENDEEQERKALVGATAEDEDTAEAA